MVDGEEQLFAKDHPIYKIMLLALVGVLLLNGINITDIASGVLGG